MKPDFLVSITNRFSFFFYRLFTDPRITNLKQNNLMGYSFKHYAVEEKEKCNEETF